MSIKDLDELIDELTLNLDNSINIISSYDTKELIKYYPSDEEFNTHKNSFWFLKNRK